MDIDRFSSLQKLLRVSAYILRFIHNCKQSDKAVRCTGQLCPTDIDKVLQAWILCAQRVSFPQEISALQSSSKNHRLPLICQLKLFFDKHSTIRCGGRIHNAEVDTETKFPCLLPKKHRLNTLIVHHNHKAHLHTGVNATVTSLREKYWIPSARQVVRSILRKCVSCCRVVGKPYSRPEPPPLPSVRTRQCRPFEVTGVDFTGALHVKTPDGSSKVYVCLFTCGITRAIHLEIVNDLSTETFLLAPRRFAARRSLPRIMLSDNASTYEAAAVELAHLINSDRIGEALCTLGIQWRFIPKRAPWYGGFWERLIGLTKTTLRKVLGKALVTLPVLQTEIVEIEAVLNDRPLTYVSADLRDPEPLTPSHLLCGRSITSMPHAITDDETSDPTFGGPSIKEMA